MAPEKRSSGACGQSQERERFFASTGTGRGTGKRNQTRRPAADGLGYTVLPISNTRIVLGGGWTSASIEAIGQAELRGAPVRRGGARGTWCRGTVCEGQRLPFRRWSMPTEGEGLQPLFRLFFSTPLLRFPILAPTVLPSLAVPVCPMLSTQWPHSYPQPALSSLLCTLQFISHAVVECHQIGSTICS